MPNYGDPKYWNKRYEDQMNRTFDWLENFSSLRPILQNLIDREHSILQLGCGNADLSSDMYDAGYHNIENIDISEVIIFPLCFQGVH
jgi:2-polyprenyl-3-methyl-5-hydroxy-6-metoxy-1,4-benzoquinol methylase